MTKYEHGRITLESMELLVPPKGWNPPPKELAGHDMFRYFALFFLDDEAGVTITQTKYFNAPISHIGAYLQERNSISDDLRAHGLYEYPKGGSVFMDVKYMRDLWIAHDGVKTYRALHRMYFHPNISPDEAFIHAQEIVSDWWNIAEKWSSVHK